MERARGRDKNKEQNLEVNETMKKKTEGRTTLQGEGGHGKKTMETKFEKEPEKKSSQQASGGGVRGRKAGGRREQGGKTREGEGRREAALSRHT